MDLAEMKSLFDIDLGPNLSKSDDYEVSETEKLMISKKANVSFAQQCEEVKSIMEPAKEVKTKNKKSQKKEETINDTDLIISAISAAATSPIALEEQKLEVSSEVEEDDNEDNAEDEGSNGNEVSQPEQVISHDPVDVNNPLELSGSDLKAYNMIKEKYPQFVLYDGSISYRDFYRWKLSVLKQTLTRFPILDISSYRQEVRDTNLDHFVGEQVLSPELIRSKIDDVYRHRIRLATLMATAYEQYPAWKRSIEMIRAKLFKDHDIKGSHKRDGIVLEHISDVELYVKELEGFIDSSKIIYSVLDAAAESLSRQLSCLITKEPTGTAHTSTPVVHKVQQQQDKSVSTTEHYDSISDGTVIKKPTGGILVEQSWSVMSDDDPLSKIG